MKIPRKMRRQFHWLKDLVPEEDYECCRVRRIDKSMLDVVACPGCEIHIIYLAMYYRVASGESLLRALSLIGAVPSYVLIVDTLINSKKQLTIYKEPYWDLSNLL